MTTSAQNSKQVLAQQGSATVPSFSFLGSGSNGWYLSGTNKVSISTNGTQAVTVDASQNVGIGTATPAAKLDIGSGNLTFSGTGQRITGDMSNATLANRVLFQTSTTNGGTSVGIIPNGTGTASAVNVFSSSDPANASYLQIRAGTDLGLARINSDITGTGTHLPMTFNTGGSERMRIDSSGNVGIGTSSPTASVPLTILANSGNAIAQNIRGRTDGIGVIRFSDNADTENGRLDFRTDYAAINQVRNAPLAFLTNSTERMRIDSSGNVGISGGGGSATNRLSLTYNGSSGEATIGPNSTGGSTFLTLGTSSSGTYAERMRIDSSGNVGIGTSSITTAGGRGLQVFASSSAANVRVTYTGFTGVDFIQGSDGSGYVWNRDNQALLFGTNNAERARITSDGYLLVNRTSSSSYPSVVSATNASKSATGAIYAETTNANYFALGLVGNNASFADHVIFNECTRSQSSAYNFLLCRSDSASSPDTEFNLRGDGNAYADGTWNNNGADYAEFFESVDGQALTVGASVVLENNKVREATDQDPASAIIGVVRPKEPSKASMMIGNTAWNKWADKYLTDDFDRYIMEDHDVIEWVDEDGKEYSYESHSVPDNVVVPDNAVRKTHDSKGNKFQHYKINPAWDKNAEYVNRENRPEWNIIGLLGQVKILKGTPIGDRWVKMRDVSTTVAEYMIR